MGCGQKRSGYRRRAAPLRRGVSFATASFFAPDEIAKAISDRPVDLAIITNLSHGMDLEQLAAIIRPIQQKLFVRMLLIDTVHFGIVEDGFAHSAEDLKSLGEVKTSVDCGDRDLHLILLAPSEWIESPPLTKREPI
jgi:hypothetical protein